MSRVVEVNPEETVLLRDIEVPKYLKECITLFPEQLDEELIRAPSDIAYWNEHYASALRDYLLAKNSAEVVRARVLIEIREKAAANGQKLTVGDLDAYVTVDDRVQAANLKEIETEAEKQLLRCRVESVTAKLEVLRSLGAKLRAEMMSDPSVRELTVGSRSIG